MPCWYPSQRWECINPTTGEVFYRFKVPKNLIGIQSIPVACRQCSGCRSRQTRDWGIRCYHESLMHDDSCFITLTVDPKYLEYIFPGGNVRYGPFQLFMRNLRKKIKTRVRFIMCAEYGDKFERPHYHGILFGFNPISQFRGDCQIIKQSKSGNLYSSRVLSELWSFGYSSVGNFDIGCAYYVAGYIHKKINGRLKDAWYKGHSQEFAKMSLKPGIGKEFYLKYTSDMFRRDKVELPGGFQFPIPKYYDIQHAFYHPTSFYKISLERSAPNLKRDLRNAPARLAARKVLLEQRLGMKSRKFEKGELM